MSFYIVTQNWSENIFTIFGSFLQYNLLLSATFLVAFLKEIFSENIILGLAY